MQCRYHLPLLILDATSKFKVLVEIGGFKRLYVGFYVSITFLIPLQQSDVLTSYGSYTLTC